MPAEQMTPSDVARYLNVSAERARQVAASDPMFPRAAIDPIASIDASAAADAFERVALCASDDESRPVLTCVALYLEVSRSSSLQDRFPMCSPPHGWRSASKQKHSSGRQPTLTSSPISYSAMPRPTASSTKSLSYSLSCR